MQEMIAIFKLDAKTRRVDVQSRPALATMQRGNDSLPITGGEVLTTVNG
jgi:hypothetical protein